MRFICFLFCFSTLISRAQNRNYYEENSKFPISELILGTWYLDKVEIIGLNENDSSTIVSNENRKCKITFFENTIETQHDTTELLYYIPSNREFYYKISLDTITNWTEIHLVSRRKKRTVTSYTLVECSFSHLIYESYESGIGLEKKQSRTRYHYVRNQNFFNPLIGKWRIDKISYPANKKNMDSIYIFQPIKDTIPEIQALNEYRFVSVIEFTTNAHYNYESFSSVLGVYLVGNYALDFSNKKLYFVSNEIVVYSFTMNKDGTLILIYDSELTTRFS